MIRIIWVLIGLNTISLLAFTCAHFVFINGRRIDSIEEGWAFILVCMGLVVILLAAIPLRYSQSTGTVISSSFFAALPLAVAAWMLVRKKPDSTQNDKTFAETYYQDKTQRRIAAAIENNDTAKLSKLITGQDLNIRGKSVWGQEGLNYLQFAIRLRTNPISFPFNDKVNTASIKILIANGIETTPALAEATKYLSPDKLLLLLNAGANPNLSVPKNVDPLLFQVINNHSIQTDVAILLIQKGADINAIKDSIYTPVMYAAFTADTFEYRKDSWRLVRYLLEEAHADYIYTAKNGSSLGSIIKNISQSAKDKDIVMPPDFNKVVTWLQERKISTEPETKLKPAV